MSPDNSIIWKPIAGLENRFLASNMGSIKSLRSKTGKGKVRKLQVSNKGYPVLGYKDEGKLKVVLVHRLIARTFIPNPLGLPQVNHKDSNPMNNRASNLEWCTQSQNIQYAVLYGHKDIIGIKNHAAKLTEIDVHHIRERLKQHDSTLSIAKDYNVSTTAIYYIKIGRNWKYLN